MDIGLNSRYDFRQFSMDPSTPDFKGESVVDHLKYTEFL